MSEPASTTIETHPQFPFVLRGRTYDFEPEAALPDADGCFAMNDWQIRIPGVDGVLVVISNYGDTRPEWDVVSRHVFDDRPRGFGGTGLSPSTLMALQMRHALDRGDIALGIAIAQGIGHADGRRQAYAELSQQLFLLRR